MYRYLKIYIEACRTFCMMDKQKLRTHCLQLLTEKIRQFKRSMQEAQQSANEENKSSMGDKYETGRAMAQIERDKNAERLNESLKMKATLEGMPLSPNPDKVSPGTLAVTSGGVFFIAIPLGKVEMEGLTVFVISPVSPLGNALLNKRIGETVTVNGRDYCVEEVV